MATATPDYSGSETLTQQERKTVIAPSQKWDNAYAKKIALGDFLKMETFRASNHDRRWQTSDQLYVAWQQKKTWEGTKIPRASIPIFTALQEIEILLGRVLQAVFADNPPFDIQPESPSTTLQQCFQIKQLLKSQMRNLGEDGKFRTLREIVRRAYKQSLMYGNGIIEFGWLLRQVMREIFEIVPQARTITIPHPVTGEAVAVPSGLLDMVPMRRMEQRSVSRPLIVNHDIRDFYIHPDCKSPCVQDSVCSAVRTLITIEEAMVLGELPGFSIPDQARLLELADKKKSTVGDASKQAGEAFRGNSWQPLDDYATDPAIRQLELIRYFRNERVVWLLGREDVVYNDSNQYGVQPFLDAFYVDFPGRFYGISVADLVEGDQKLAAAIINARLDELNLILHAPIVRRAGSMRPNTWKRMSPGVVWETDGEPGKDIMRMEMGTVNPTAFAEVNALELRTQKLTGNTDLAAMGTTTGGGNSANRTAAGINTQTAASNTRIQARVEDLEDQFLEPLIYCILALNKRFLDPAQAISIIGDGGMPINIDPLAVLNADVTVEVQASVKMKARQALQGGGIQLLLEMGTNPQLIQQLNMTGQTIDLGNIFSLALDAMNLPQRALIRPLNQQESQMLGQPGIQDKVKMAMQQQRLAAMQTKQDSQDDTKLLHGALQKLLTPEIANEMAGIKPEPAGE